MFTSLFRIFFIFSVFLLNFSGQQILANQEINEKSDEESFLIRRIAEFWKDGDYNIVKIQIQEFLDSYPESDMNDYFHGILGDIFIQENNYADSLKAYSKITDDSIIEKIILNKLQCYYELDKYAEIIEDGTAFLSNNTIEFTERKEELYFLLGEAHFRKSLTEDDLNTKEELSREARNYYENLTESQYKEIINFALAEIAGTLKEYETAANIYLDLVDKHPNMKEELLFQAASLEAKYNNGKAIETFRQVKEINGKHSQEAAFNLMVLFFQNEEYEEVLSSYESIAAFVPDDHMPSFHFIVGKSFFSTGQYQNAYSPIQCYIDSTYVASDQLKNALLIQMTCAHQINDEVLFNDSFEKLNTLFPKDDEIPNALFMHAMILKEKGNHTLANEKLTLIQEEYKNFENQETLTFEYGFLAHQTERWNDSYGAFKEYIENYPESSRINAARKLFFSSSLKLYTESTESKDEDKNKQYKTNFFVDLKETLTHEECFTSEELQDYQLLYAKIAYELEYYTETLHYLQDHFFTQITEENASTSLAEAHFIAGLCYAELQTDNSAFCMHLEQAMALNSDLYDSQTTHIQLYNAYISLVGFGESDKINAEQQQQEEFLENAAEHLQEAINKGYVTIKEENRLWLANHYYEKVKKYYESHITQESSQPPEFISAIDRASKHYEILFFSENVLSDINANNLHLETEILKFAKILEYQKFYEKKLAIIKNLLEQQTTKPNLNWISKNQALYELATTYHCLGHKEQAYETYSFINSQENTFPTDLAYNASLEAACLHFELLDNTLKIESNKEVHSILNNLKKLQIRKNATSEPVHLQAALEYVRIRTEISDAKEQDKKHLFFLNRMKDDFTSEDDLVTHEYLEKIKENDEKRQLYSAYMTFIDAEKMRIEAKNMYQKDRLDEMKELHEQALTLYNEIKNNHNTPIGLSSRITTSIQEINNLNAY